MDNNFVVYKHISPSEKVYIGITCQDAEKRWQNGYGYRYNTHFYRAIQKYGWSNFKHEILFEELTEEEAKLMEQMYIALYDTTNQNKGYNLTKGGDGTIGYRHSLEARFKMKKNNSRYMLGKHHTKETKEKLSKLNKGKSLTEETKRKLSESHKGKCLTEETKKKISMNNGKSMLGKHHTKETKEKLSKSQKERFKREKHPWDGKHHTEESKTKNRNSQLREKGNRARKVICLNNSEIFDCIKLIEDKYGIDPSCISKVCTGKRKTAGRINGEPARWMYYEDYLKEHNNKEIS